jgi:chemotaxis signal transduction protein
VVPVIDLGQRLGQPARPTDLDDMLVVVDATRHRWALHVGPHVDLVTIEVDDVRELDLEAAPYSSGVITMADGLVAIYDVDAFLSSDEVIAVDELLARHERAVP